MESWAMNFVWPLNFLRVIFYNCDQRASALLTDPIGQSLHEQVIMSYGNPNSPSSPPYNSGGYLSDPPPKKSSNTLMWVLGILGVLGLGTLAVCCGGGYMMYSWGTNLIAEEMKPRLQNDPSIQEHIGEISVDEFRLWSHSGASG